MTIEKAEDAGKVYGTDSAEYTISCVYDLIRGICGHDATVHIRNLDGNMVTGYEAVRLIETGELCCCVLEGD